MERFLDRLYYSPGGWLSRISGSSMLLRSEADPVEQERILTAAEMAVYGTDGINRYEQSEDDRLSRCARRSLAQHLSHEALIAEPWALWIRFVAAIAALPFLILFGIVRSARTRSDTNVKTANSVAFAWVPRLEKYTPMGLLGDESVILHRTHGARLGLREFHFLFRAIRSYPRLLAHPPLLLHLTRWLAYYGYVVYRYRPATVINFVESAAASSLLTAYLGECGVRHVNVQHGEIVYSAFYAFAEFDEVVVWGAYFREILSRLKIKAFAVRLSSSPFHRRLVQEIRYQVQPRPARLLILDPFTEDDATLDDSYAKLISVAAERGWAVRFRRHPADRRQELPIVRRLTRRLDNKMVDLQEDSAGVGLEDALIQSRIIAGVASAALIEGWIAGCKVVHLPGRPSRAVIMERYEESDNVLFLDRTAKVDRFFDTRTDLEQDDGRIERLFSGCHDERTTTDVKLDHASPSVGALA